MFSYIVFVLYVGGIFGINVALASTDRTCREVDHGSLICNHIPMFIHDGIFKVHLAIVLYNDTDLTNTTFINRGWNEIRFLELAFKGTLYMITFRENCFNGLNKLQALKINTPNRLSLNSKTFNHLNKVESLDLSGCSRLRVQVFAQAINGSNKLPLLRTLNFSNCCLFEASQISIDDNVFKSLESKRISFIDMSGLPISFIDVTSGIKILKYLKNINASYATLGDFNFKRLEQKDVKRVENIDLSFISLPKKVLPLLPGKLNVSGVVSLSNVKSYHGLTLMFSIRAWNFTGIIPHQSSYWFERVTINIDRKPDFLTKSLILRRNNMRWLDVNLICDRYKIVSLEYVDMSENGLEFIHPSFSSCFPNVQYIDLSKNSLSNMAKENALLFKELFSNGKFLQHLSLSNNKLDKVPLTMFRHNKNIKTIDLSYNKLDQVHFELKGLNNLEILNLQGNNIHILDGISIDNLNCISNSNGIKLSHTSVILKSNPLSCSKCETKSFISWLVSTDLVNLTSQEVNCFNEHGTLEHVTKHTVDKVQEICQREIIVVVTSVLAGVIALAIIVGSIVMYKKIKHKRKLQNRESALELLHKGEDRYKFAVFLAFSNEDEGFVDKYIINQLNENLQLMTGLDRELVCTGDRHFRPGFYVHNEGFRALDAASVVIVVASNNFCNSSYCRNELDQAYVKKKPIVLMLIESIEPEVMVPTMRESFQRNVRILWTQRDGEYHLKTTWENVCTSVLDLIEI